ncbi:hypothetical protein [Kribbella steppae]|uniref:hypothetical protein n=1 Tax=Kribbella steppae TaxID=2512223 RepID=UPI00104AB12E|nr:hypothetical protein [Kribbella steppae]
MLEQARRLFATPQGTTAGHASTSQLVHHAPEAFTLSIAGRTRDAITVGRLTLLTPLADTGDRFDPVLNCPPNWRLAPAWLREIREAAYRGSRHGRDHATDPNT